MFFFLFSPPVQHLLQGLQDEKLVVETQEIRMRERAAIPLHLLPVSREEEGIAQIPHVHEALEVAQLVNDTTLFFHLLQVNTFAAIVGDSTRRGSRSGGTRSTNAGRNRSSSALTASTGRS